MAKRHISYSMTPFSCVPVYAMLKFRTSSKMKVQAPPSICSLGLVQEFIVLCSIANVMITSHRGGIDLKPTCDTSVAKSTRRASHKSPHSRIVRSLSKTCLSDGASCEGLQSVYKKEMPRTFTLNIRSVAAM